MAETASRPVDRALDAWAAGDHAAALRYAVPILEAQPDSGSLPRRPLVMNEQEQWGIIDWPLKLMVRPADNLTELYDLDRDFGEKHDLSTQRTIEVSRLKAAYASHPRPLVDRTPAGRRHRDELARRPAHR